MNSNDYLSDNQGTIINNKRSYSIVTPFVVDYFSLNNESPDYESIKV